MTLKKVCFFEEKKYSQNLKTPFVHVVVSFLVFKTAAWYKDASWFLNVQCFKIEIPYFQADKEKDYVRVRWSWRDVPIKIKFVSFERTFEIILQLLQMFISSRIIYTKIIINQWAVGLWHSLSVILDYFPRILYFGHYNKLTVMR